jgi:hypothetical protein
MSPVARRRLCHEDPPGRVCPVVLPLVPRSRHCGGGRARRHGRGGGDRGRASPVVAMSDSFGQPRLDDPATSRRNDALSAALCGRCFGPAIAITVRWDEAKAKGRAGTTTSSSPVQGRGGCPEFHGTRDILRRCPGSSFRVGVSSMQDGRPQEHRPTQRQLEVRRTASSACSWPSGSACSSVSAGPRGRVVTVMLNRHLGEDLVNRRS